MIHLDLPQPPSVNYAKVSARGANGRSRMILSRQARDYLQSARQRALIQMRQQGYRIIRDGDVEMHVYWLRATKRGDLTNRIKLLEDALNGVAYTDDRQIAASHQYRIDGLRRGRVLVTVAPRRALTEAEAEAAFGSTTQEAA